ncbi:MAG: hypothetical protein ABIN23_07850 [candidate division WOR-3 bacterium]
MPQFLMSEKCGTCGICGGCLICGPTKVAIYFYGILSRIGLFIK